MSETPSPSFEVASVVSADELAAPLAASMPQVKVPAPAVPENRLMAAPPAPAPAPEKDSLGRAFDPEKFRPERDSLGRWKNLFAGRGGKAAKVQSRVPGGLFDKPKPAAPAAPPPSASFIPGLEEAAGGPAAPQGPEPAQEAPEPAKAPGGPDRFTLLADVYCRAAIAAAMGTISDEWAPDDDGEYIGLRDAAAAYLRATGRDDLSPGAALGFACLTYGAKRLPRPKTQNRLASWKAKIWAWWKGRSIARAVDALPHVEKVNT
jgi:hypothetical protein